MGGELDREALGLATPSPLMQREGLGETAVEVDAPDPIELAAADDEEEQRRRSSTPPALAESESSAAMARIPSARDDARSAERVMPRAGGMS